MKGSSKKVQTDNIMNRVLATAAELSSLFLSAFSRQQVFIAVFAGTLYFFAYEAGHVSPAYQSAISISLIMAFFTSLLFSGSSTSMTADIIHNSSTARLVSNKSKASSEVVYTRCFHEASHAIGHCLLRGDLIESSLWVSDLEGVEKGGYASYETSSELLRKDLLVVSRIISLLPIAAEKTIRGFELAGSGNDLSNWESNTKELLNNYPNSESWFVSPSSKFESQINADTLNKLQATDIAIASEYALKNKDVIIDIADKLKSSLKMDYEELKPFFERVLLDNQLTKEIGIMR